MRVLICGGRDFNDYEHLCRRLDYERREFPISTVIHGGAPGADALASRWARERGIAVEEYPARWDLYGPAAGPMRNAQMLREGKPELVIAFPGGKGTRNMKMQARLAGVRVMEIPGRTK